MAGAIACGGVGGVEGGVADGEDGGEGAGAGGDVVGEGGGLRRGGREEGERFFGWGLGAAGEVPRRGVGAVGGEFVGCRGGRHDDDG